MKNNKNLTINWLSDYIQSYGSSIRTNDLKGDKVNNLMAQFLPITNDYFSPMNAIFLYYCPNEDYLNRKPHWYIRDGLIPILYKLKFLDPTKIRSTLYVSSEVYKLLPFAWRNIFKPVTPISKSNRIHELIISFVPYSLFNTSTELKTNLNALKKFLLSQKIDIKKIPISVYIPQLDARSLAISEKDIFNYYNYIINLFGKNITPLSWKEFSDKKNFSSILYFESNNNLLVSDTYSRFLAITRGCLLYSQNSLNSSKKIKVSQNFELVVSTYTSKNIIENKEIYSKDFYAFEKKLQAFEKNFDPPVSYLQPWSWRFIQLCMYLNKSK